jgi:ATP-dependent DNA helicase RecQ
LDGKDCRSLSLQHYFGEEATEPCGVCDLCVVRQHKSGVSESIEKKIQYLLLEKPLPLHDLIEAIEIGKEEDRLKVLRSLMDSDTVKIEDDLYHWNAF